MRFTKMHGAGNDFVVINTIEENISLRSMTDGSLSLIR